MKNKDERKIDIKEDEEHIVRYREKLRDRIK